MIKKILIIAFTAFIISSCGNTATKEKVSGNAGSSEAAKIEFASLISDPSPYIGKNISVEGTVVHVCAMSGKKLFITGDNPDVRLYIQAGENMPKFPMELLGSKIVVEGSLVKATAGSMMGEGEMMSNQGTNPAECAAKTMGADTCETAKALSAQLALSDLMMVYNKHTVID